MPFHTEQPSLAQQSSSAAVLTLPDHALNRNNRALMMLQDWQLTPGLSVSEEADGQVFAHTSDVAWDQSGQRLLVVWSEGQVGQTPRSIHFRSVEGARADPGLLLVPRHNAAYERDRPEEVARWDGQRRVLLLKDGASAGMQLPSEAATLELTVDLSGVADEATLLAAGNTENRVRWRYLASKRQVLFELLRGRDSSAQPTVQVAAIDVPETARASFLLRFGWDPRDRTLSIAPGLSSTLSPGFYSVFLGDGFLDGRSSEPSRLVFAVPLSVAQRCTPDAAGPHTAACRALGVVVR
jgi:hypothetical protein